MVVRERLVEIIKGIEGVEIAGVAADEPEARALVAGSHPDVVVLDIRIPGGSGIDVLQYVKARAPSPVVIMLTNFPYPQFREKCLELGADHFLDKTLEFERVPQILSALVREQDSRPK
jgi:DNA-binding NarL/FixJ family response regulator